MNRKQVFEKLRSFDHQGLDDAAFSRSALKLLAGSFADAEAVHRHFLDRTPPVKLPEAPTPSGEEAAKAGLELADNCLKNVFEFYGERHFVGEAIDWNKNPGNDHWVHDLNRFSFLTTLHHAARTSGDEKYLRKAAALILDWVGKCCVTDSWFWRRPEQSEWDMGNGVWRSYLNIAIHCQRWTVYLDELARFWSPLELLRVLKSIHDQLAYLEEIIPTMKNNWMVIGSDGMLGTAARLPELRDRRRFIAYAWEKIAAEARRQVLPDGVQFELTQSYHMCVLRLLLNSTAVSREAGLDVPEEMDGLTAKMLDYTMQMCAPDGLTIAFNDSDPDSGASYRGALTKEGRARGRADWLYVGTEGAEGSPPQVLSQAFEHGGVYAMRSGWDRKATLLVFDGGPWGVSHQHNDRLSFQLSALGRALIVDPGRYLYDGNNPYSRLNYLNTTRAHSTIGVDGEEQADRWFPDLKTPGPKLTDNTWIVNDAWQRVAGSHILGYGKNGCIRAGHRRSVTFWPSTHDAGVFLVLDRVAALPDGKDGEQEHEIHSRLQFAPGDVVETNRIWHSQWDDANLAVLPLMDASCDVCVEKGLLNPTRGWFSPGVNRIEPSPTLVVRGKSKLPLRAAFLLVPYRGTKAPKLELSFNASLVELRVGETFARVDFDEALR